MYKRQDIRLKLNAASGLDASATVSAADGSAVGYHTNQTTYDYTLSDATGTTSLSIPAYSTGVTVPVTINDDDYFEDNEDFTLTLAATAGSNNATGSANHTYSITQNNSDDPVPSLYFSTVGPTEVTETDADQTGLTLTVNLSAASGKAVGFTYSVTDLDKDGDGTDAVNGAAGDFVLSSGAGSIDIYGTSTTIPYTVVGDDTDESDKTIEVTIVLATGEEDATLGLATHQIKIIDDDDPVGIQFTSASTTKTELLGYNSGSGITITMDKSGSTELTATVTLADAGTGTATDNANADLDDYDVSGLGTISFGPTETQKSFTLTVDNDGLYEGSTNETAIFTLATGSNSNATGNTTHTFNIEDDEEIPTIQFSSTSSSGDETTNSVPLTVTLNRKSAFASTVVYTAAAKAGQATTEYVTSGDYTLSSSTLTVTANSLTADVPLVVATDALYELDEIITVTLSSPCAADDSYCTSGTNTTHDYTINGAGTAPVLDFNLTASTPDEADGTGTVTVELSTATGYPATVAHALNASSTATASGSGADYTYTPNTLTFNPELSDGTAAVTSQNISLTFTDDATNEAGETIAVSYTHLTLPTKA